MSDVLPTHCQVALKEWASVVEAFSRGEQLVLVRKGGLAEARSGFTLASRLFLFYPTFEHQTVNYARSSFTHLFDEALRQRLAESATVWTSGRVNINTVNRDVLAAFIADEGLVTRLVESRPGPDGRLGTADDCVAVMAGTAAADLASCSGVDQQALVSLLTQQSFEVRSSVFRVLVVAAVEALGVRYRVEAVVRRGAGASGDTVVLAHQPFQILAWREG